MNNPIPAAVRLWLYLAAAVVLTIAVGGIVPESYYKLVMTVAAVLQVLAAANVSSTAVAVVEPTHVATVQPAAVPELPEADPAELDAFADDNPADPEVEGREGLA